MSDGDELPPPPAAGSNVMIIGVAGGSGCGKSVLCNKLETMIAPHCPVIVLSYDNYYKDKEEVDEQCGGNWDCPEALNTQELVKHLRALKQGLSIVVPFYDFATNRQIQELSQEIKFEPGAMGVLLVEGLMVLYDEDLRNMIDVRIFIDW
jgi:uridine kinase